MAFNLCGFKEKKYIFEAKLVEVKEKLYQMQLNRHGNFYLKLLH